MKITILGCGAAGGLPTINMGWGKCDPTNPRNRRRRQSILVEQGGTTILVDTSPDLREQLLDIGVRRLDAVLYTHAHADHLHGIDDLREVNRAMNGPIDCYATADTMAMIQHRFDYVFKDAGHGQALRVVFRPWLVPHEIAGPFKVGEVAIQPFEQDHGFGQTTIGFRFRSAAYSTDVTELPEESFAQLEGLDLWIVGCLSDKSHETHAHVEKALGWVKRLKPKHTVLVHLGPRLDYAELAATLPEGIVPAYDGMVLEV
ncbi:MAG TPA: MBL fold metallo-hydrolase [Magnetospirillaceae bacterium]|jgi:phosphoribosyl 1,2-cyclic phosphate phosphodiesterase